MGHPHGSQEFRESGGDISDGREQVVEQQQKNSQGIFYRFVCVSYEPNLPYVLRHSCVFSM